MKKSEGVPGPRTLVVRAALTAFAFGAAAPGVLAHGGSLQAPLQVAGPTINGTIEALWGLERTGAPAMGCPYMRVYALRTATNYYVAVDVPELVEHPNDMLAVFFDANHDADGTPDAADRAVRLLGFPAGTNQASTSPQIYAGNGATWAAPAAFGGARASRTGSGGNARLTVEIEIPVTAAPSGFAVFYLSGDTPPQDCDGDSIADASFKWPAGLPNPGGPDPGLTDASTWGDIGKKVPVVAFAAPTCCHSADITFTPNVQPFTAGIPVNITARVHNTDTGVPAANVKVQVRVHDFGTGGGVVFTTAPTDPVIAAIGASANASTSPVTWASPPAGLHGCIRAEIQPPPGTSLDDYALAVNSMAQHNIDVACVPSGSKKAMKFAMENPDRQKEQRIFLVKRERLPRGMKGLKFDVIQPDRPLRPGEQFQATLALAVDAGVPPAKPWKRAAIPPAAGGTGRGPADAPEETPPAGTAVARVGPVAIAVKPGMRLHVMASGEVDLDGAGRLAPMGPEGRDVSKEMPEGRFLLAGSAARLYGGALIGSFDGFRTSFALGREATVTVPPRATTLGLAVNDLVRRHGDNTGKGFAVQVFPVPAATGAKDLVVPEVDVFATTRADIQIAQRRYVVTHTLGGVTYQIVVMP